MSLAAHEEPAPWPPQRSVEIEIKDPRECRRLLSRAQVGAALEGGAGASPVSEEVRALRSYVKSQMGSAVVLNLLLIVLTVCVIVVTVYVADLVTWVKSTGQTLTAHLQPKDVDAAISSGMQSIQNVQLTTGSMAHAGELVEAGAAETVAAINTTNGLITYANMLMANVLHNPSIQLSLSGQP